MAFVGLGVLLPLLRELPLGGVSFRIPGPSYLLATPGTLAPSHRLHVAIALGATPVFAGEGGLVTRGGFKELPGPHLNVHVGL